MSKKIRVVHYGIGHDHSPQFLECILKYPEIFECIRRDKVMSEEIEQKLITAINECKKEYLK